MSHAFAGRSAATDGTALEKGRVNLTKVKRYWTGRAPEWAAEEETEELEQKRQPAAPVIIRAVADPRLERLSLSETKPQPSVPDHRRIHKEADEPDIKEEFTEASALAHRAQLRSKLIEKRRDEPELLPEEDDEEETLSEDSDTEEEEEIVLTRPPMMKPIFVSSEERETIRERMKLEEEEEREWEAQKQKLMQRQQDTKEIVAQKIKEDEALQNKDDLPKEANDINTDEEEEDGEFEAWKERERNRIQRDKEEVLASEKYAQERERLKNMTEEERKIYDRLNPKIVKKAPKKKWKFLQKYWHKGAYYQEDPDDIRATAGTHSNVFLRDFSDPTGEDKVDKEMLPKIMQVKNFGRSGRTKWTHLVNEDTTGKDDPWTSKNTMRMKYNRRMAASEQEFDKPKKLKS